MELEKLEISGLSNTYAIANVKKEFQKAVDEPWKEVPPWQRYLKKLIADLAVLEQKNDSDYQRAINTAKVRLRWLNSD